MILLLHNHNILQEVIDLDTNEPIMVAQVSIPSVMLELAKRYPESILVWCDVRLRSILSLKGIKACFHFKNMMISYGNDTFFSEQIGFVEDSPFLKVNKQVKYPTWLMSSAVGAIYGSQILKFEHHMDVNMSLGYVLNSIAKTGMSGGLLCYSEPGLIKGNWPTVYRHPKANKKELFKFVKQHYRVRWGFLLFLNLLLYEKELALIAFIYSLFYSRISIRLRFDFEPLNKNGINLNSSIDVIIPTIGRKNYLYDVLCDLREQTWLPEKVIIVEQNPDEGSESALDYLETEDWPFTIKHIFTHQTGACYARNLALKEVTADWVFLADDDNRFSCDLLQSVLEVAHQYKFNVITTAYPQPQEKILVDYPRSSGIFGSGNSFLRTRFLEHVTFDTAFEFGYGEDNDFGMQLRNIGEDILYIPEPYITHLKAPRGGFRTVFKQQWHDDEVQPKPSPTVMLFKLKHQTRTQLLGYKTTLFFKYYKQQPIKNPLKYLKNFKKQWERSVYWAEELRSLN